LRIFIKVELEFVVELEDLADVVDNLAEDKADKEDTAD
jgi:hypothetical protein